MEIMSFGVFSTGPHQNWPEAVCEIPDPSGLVAIFAGLKSARLHFFRQESWRCLTLIWTPYVRPSPQNGTVYWWITPAGPALILPPQVRHC